MGDHEQLGHGSGSRSSVKSRDAQAVNVEQQSSSDTPEPSPGPGVGQTNGSGTSQNGSNIKHLGSREGVGCQTNGASGAGRISNYLYFYGFVNYNKCLF